MSVSVVESLYILLDGRELLHVLRLDEEDGSLMRFRHVSTFGLYDGGNGRIMKVDHTPRQLVFFPECRTAVVFRGCVTNDDCNRRIKEELEKRRKVQDALYAFRSDSLKGLCPKGFSADGWDNSDWSADALVIHGLIRRGVMGLCSVGIEGVPLGCFVPSGAYDVRSRLCGSCGSCRWRVKADGVVVGCAKGADMGKDMHLVDAMKLEAVRNLCKSEGWKTVLGEVGYGDCDEHGCSYRSESASMLERLSGRFASFFSLD